MLPEELILTVIISLVIGFTLGFFYVKAQITAIENTYRAELERWKAEVSGEIRNRCSKPVPFDAKRKDRRTACPGASRVLI